MTSRTAFVHKVWKSFLDNAGHDANCFESMKLVKVEKDLVICSLKVESKHLNRLNGLHGGLIASLIDTTGQFTLSL